MGVGMVRLGAAMGSDAGGAVTVGGLLTATALGGGVGGTAVWIGGDRRRGAGLGGMAAATIWVLPGLLILGKEIEAGDGLVR